MDVCPSVIAYGEPFLRIFHDLRNSKRALKKVCEQVLSRSVTSQYVLLWLVALLFPTVKKADELGKLAALSAY